MGEARQPDFDGWATKVNMKCSDGRTIMPGAFKHMDKQKVPLVYMHNHTDPENILGHALLEDRAFGTYAQGFFNNSPRALVMKEAVVHGDIESLSVYANNLSERRVGKDSREVHHGDIRELSLVLVGANPGALIENVYLRHSETGIMEEIADEAIIFTGESLLHSGDVPVDIKPVEGADGTDDEQKPEDKSQEGAMEGAELQHADQKTAQQIFDGMDEEEQNVVLYMVAEAFEAGAESKNGELEQSGIDINEESLTHFKQEGPEMANIFDRDNTKTADRAVLSHSEQADLIAEARRDGKKLSEVIKSNELKHADTDDRYGVENIEFLFPDARALDASPQFIKRDTTWVGKVLDAVKKVPFAKVKSIVADITAEEARARGYVKGTMKKDEVIELLKRTTGPTTIYKKQRLDRDDILDITDFDIVAWLKAEIRVMLDEEIARAILIGDGRSASNPDKIKDPRGANSGDGIRSIANDNEMYAHPVQFEANSSPRDDIKTITRAFSAYKGTGNPTFYTTNKALVEMLLVEDQVGRRLYDTKASLAAVLQVNDIVTVEVLEEYDGLLGIIVNLVDYTIGTNQGGGLTFFSDFDIDFNQEKYLMETRLSGALTKPKSALVLKRDEGTSVTPAAPSFNGTTNTITIPASTGVVYLINDEPVTGSIKIEEDTTVDASAPSQEFYIPAGATRSWSYQYTSA